jgi:hypothetical protein
MRGEGEKLGNGPLAEDNMPVTTSGTLMFTNVVHASNEEQDHGPMSSKVSFPRETKLVIMTGPRTRWVFIE